MSPTSPPAKTDRGRPAPRVSAGAEPPAPRLGLRSFDALLVAALLALAFLLGAFPLKDTDFWWHLRAGDDVRRAGAVPTVDPFTYGAPGAPWVDLHWVFQVLVSLGYQWGGVPALTLGKCAVTTLGLLLLVTARRREWPVWAAVAAWLPALLVLSGRMYVRPETLSFLYLAIYLAVLSRIDRLPGLAFVLPAVQAAWVNTQGLFVLGPVVFGFALVDAALRPGSFGPGRKRWWRLVGLAGALSGLACLLNPYGLAGALYPIELARTMANPVFSNAIAELTPIPVFLQRDGFRSLPMRLHVLVLVVGALSFLLPVVWLVAVRVRGGVAAAPTPAKSAGKKGGRSKKSASPAVAAGSARSWRLSPFRLALFAAFGLLSWRATRNSHQFAAVAGAVTAWNFAEWAGAVRRRAWDRRGPSAILNPGLEWWPRALTLAAVVGVFSWVAGGGFYAASREGRTIGLGEQPLWYPHEAVEFAGTTPGLPPRFLGFHIGHASLYEYRFGPEKKVYADARLEVIGPDLFERYTELQRRITADDPGWRRDLDALGRPVVLADHEANAAVSATLLGAADWPCVWFDPIAAVFAHADGGPAVAAHAVDFAARHFRPDPKDEPRGYAALLASAKGLRNIASGLSRSGPARALPLVLLGSDHARRVARADPGGADGWKLLGQFETLREPPGEPVPRFRLPFDPVFDLATARATYAFRRALAAAPDDFLTLLLLSKLFEARRMTEAALPILDRLARVPTINGMQGDQQAVAAAGRAAAAGALGPPPPARWENVSELDRIVDGLLAAGRAGTAADYLERDRPPGAMSWTEADRVATLRLHLGEPTHARAVWRGAVAPPRPGLREARVAATLLVEGSTDAARDAYRAAAAADPALFEAHYGLAVLEQDDGRANPTRDAARKAVVVAPTDVARTAARSLIATVSPYADPEIAEATR